MEKYLLLLLILLSQIFCNPNLVQNGDFQLPILQGRSITCPISWRCSTIINTVAHLLPNAFPTQYIYLYSAGTSTWVEQSISVSEFGVYGLEILYGRTSGGAVLNVFWNGLTVGVIVANGTLILNTFQVNIQQSYGVLKIQILDAWADIDNVRLVLLAANSTQAPPTPQAPQVTESSTSQNLLFQQQIVIKFAVLLSLPLSSYSGLNPLYLMLADLWMFSFTYKYYKGIVQVVFQTIQEIQNIKMQAIASVVNISKPSLVLSNYTSFTDEKFVEQENCSSVFIQKFFWFLTLEIPQTVIICFIFSRIFNSSKKCPRIRKAFKQYFFLKQVIIYELVEQNLIFFVFASFNNLSMPFSFKFLDRLSFMFTILMLFCFVMFTCIFFFMLGRFRISDTSVFNDGVIRKFKGHQLLTLYINARIFLRAAIFFFLRKYYIIQMFILGSIEILTVLNLILANNRNKKNLFQHKTSFILQLLYHIIFGFLHFCFILEESWLAYEGSNQQILGFILQFQEIVVYLLTAIILLKMLFGIMPSQLFEKKKGDVEENKLRKQKQKVKKIKVDHKEKARKKSNENKKHQNNVPVLAKSDKIKQPQKNVVNNKKSQENVGREKSKVQFINWNFIEKELTKLQKQKIVEEKQKNQQYKPDLINNRNIQNSFNLRTNTKKRKANNTRH